MNFVEINLEKWINSGLELSHYLIIQLKVENRDEDLNKVFEQYSYLLEELEKLEKRGYIKITDKKNWVFSLRMKSLSLFSYFDEDNIENWIEEYRELFPPKYKGDRIGCIHKMKKFKKKYPKFSKDLILNATRKYINEKHRENFRFLRQAHYFIEKDNVSDLASFCEISQFSKGEDAGSSLEISL